MTEIHARDITMVPLDDLSFHPNNPRRGDVEAIIESITYNGFVTPLIVQRSTGRVLAGNHRLLAAQQLGLEAVPVVYLDVDDQHALRILLADNRASDLGYYDDNDLAALLQEMGDPDALVGTLYSEADLEVLLRNTGYRDMPGTDPHEEWVGMPEFSQDDRRPQHTIAVHFLTIEDKARFAREILGRDTPPRFAWWPQDDGFVGSDTGVAFVSALDDERETAAG